MKSPEYQKRAVREYFLSESPEGVTVSHIEKVATHRILDRKHDIWDLHASDGRWWIITEPTNLYSQDRFPSMDETFTFHVGLVVRMMAKESKKPNAGIQEVARLGETWRRFENAGESLDSAEEAEDFQAVGMRCREVLLTFISEVKSDGMVPQGHEIPKTADFPHWSEHIIRQVCGGQHRAKLRSYLQAMCGETWRYVNWLTHTRNATRFDAAVAIDMINDLLSFLAHVLIRSERKLPGRCPMCGSYRLYADFRVELMQRGLQNPYVTLCEACGWEGDEDIEPPITAPSS